MRATSIDLRKRVVAARVEDGQSLGVIAERFRMPKSTVQNILRRHQRDGTVEPKTHGGGRRAQFSPDALRRLEKEVQCHPDATLEELRERNGVQVTLVAYHKRLKQLGFTRKKKRYVRESNAGKMS
jgi:transposase